MEQDIESGMDFAMKLFLIGLAVLVVGVGFLLSWEWALITLGAVLVVSGVVVFRDFAAQQSLVDHERAYRQKELYDDE